MQGPLYAGSNIGRQGLQNFQVNLLHNSANFTILLSSFLAVSTTPFDWRTMLVLLDTVPSR
jgi:hypothetical protein